MISAPVSAASTLRLGALLLPFLFAFAQASSAGAQADSAQASQDDGIFFDNLDVTLVNVEVFVTDKKGQRVTGLTRDDFEIFEDGKKMAIQHFSAVEGRRPSLPTRQPPAATPPATPPSSTPPAETPEAATVVNDQSLRVVVFFDNLHLRPFSRNKALREVRRFLGTQLQPGDEAMLVTFERSLNVRHPFTTDLEAVRLAMDEVETLSAFAVESRTDRRDLIKLIDQSETFEEAETFVDSHAQEIYDNAGRTISALKELVGSLAGLPGRKAILYVSDGLPMTAAGDLFYWLDQKYRRGTTGQLRAARYRLLRSYRELTAAANANQITFYPLEAEGSRARDSVSAARAGQDSTFIEVEGVQAMNMDEPLILMADDTGGVAAVNTNNLGFALDRVAEDLASYYLLSYRPTYSSDGRYHKIEVKAKRRGLELRHRQGYRAKTPEVRVREGTLAALLHRIESNPLAVELATGAPRPRDRESFLTPVTVRIPIGQLALIPQGEYHRARLRVAVAALDAEGQLSAIHQEEVPLEIPNGEVEVARQKHFTYAVELMMRPGRQWVAVGLRDDFSAETSYVRVPVEVGR